MNLHYYFCMYLLLYTEIPAVSSTSQGQQQHTSVESTETQSISRNPNGFSRGDDLLDNGVLSAMIANHLLVK